MSSSVSQEDGSNVDPPQKSTFDGGVPKEQIFLPLFRALVRRHLEYAIQANCPYLKKDIYHLERIQRAAMRWVKGLSYEEMLKEIKLQSLEKKEG